MSKNGPERLLVVTRSVTSDLEVDMHLSKKKIKCLTGAKKKKKKIDKIRKARKFKIRLDRFALIMERKQIYRNETIIFS